MHTTSQVKAAPAAQPSIAKPAAQPLMASAVETVEAPSLAEQMARARLGHSFGAISVLPPDPPSIQPKRMVESAQRLSALRPMGQGRVNPAPVIPAGWAAPSRVQTKLTVGEPNDPYEQEADHVADQVMRMAEPRVQAKCACGGEAGPDGECAACKAQRLGVQRQVQDQMPEEESVVQAKSDTAPAEAAPDLESRLSGSRGSGQALPADTRDAMESAFGADFGGVRVHTGNEAVQMNKELNAQAFTHGSDIYFNAGKYEPGSTEGKGLLAHELTHVVQQAPNPTIMRSQLFASTLETCRRDGIRSRNFHVSQGGVVVTANATFEGESRYGCTDANYHMTLNRIGTIFDSEYGTCDFRQGEPFSRQWANLPEGDYYLQIWTGNTNPNCCLRGDIIVEERSISEGGSCTQPPPGPLEILHTALQVAGLIPALGAIPDAIDAGIYVIEGDWPGAGLSAAAIIPIFGDAASIGRIGARTVLRVSGDAVTRVGREGIETGLREARVGRRVATETGRGARGVVRRIITEGGLNHSFDRHAAEWFGGVVTREGHFAAWRAIIERVAASRQTFRWSLTGRSTIAHLGRVPLEHTQGPGRYFVVQFFEDSGELATAFVPNPEQLAQMFRLL